MSGVPSVPALKFSDTTTKAPVAVPVPTITPASPFHLPPMNVPLPVAPGSNPVPPFARQLVPELKPFFELFQIFLPEKKSVELGSPYLGMHNDRIWDENGILGSFVSPIEHIYLGWYPEHTRKTQTSNE